MTFGLLNHRKNKQKAHTEHIISYFAVSLTDCQNNLIGGPYGLFVCFCIEI